MAFKFEKLEGLAGVNRVDKARDVISDQDLKLCTILLTISLSGFRL